jgi:hypothetical protein
MSSGSTTFLVRQVYYAGVGSGAAVFCSACAFAFWGNWSSFILLVFAGGCVFYAVWNAGLAYVLDEQGLTRSSRWGTQRQIRWSNVSTMKYFDRDMTLILLLRDNSRLHIRCGELPGPEAFREEVQRLASATGVKSL